MNEEMWLDAEGYAPSVDEETVVELQDSLDDIEVQGDLDLDQSPVQMTRADRLAACEKVAVKGLKAGMDAYVALRTIRDEKLYDERGFKDFGSYCRRFFGISLNYANKNIAAAERLEKIGTIVPKRLASGLTCEGQVRELASVPDDKIVEVLAEAESMVEGDRITAAAIRKARAKVAPVEKKAKETVEDEPGASVGSESVPVSADKVVERAKRLANESIEKLALQLSHLGILRKWGATLDKLTEEIEKL